MDAEIGRVRTMAIAAGGVAAVFGLYWDDAWHTDVGRDTFLSPPHLLLYAGVGVLLVAAATWAWRRCRIEGWAALRDPTLALPLFGAAVSLGAAPLDELWHQLFGRDSVVWSPPHMVIVAGLIAFAAGLLLAVQRASRRPLPGTAAVIGAFLIAATGTVVMEFEADVPQFPIVWYLPVAVGGLTFAFALLHRLSDGLWTATQAAGVYVTLRIGVVGFLAGLGHSLPTVMPTIVAAGAFDLAVRRGVGRSRIAAATAAATVASHVAAHAVHPAGLSFTAREVAFGAVAGLLAAWVALAVIGVGVPGRAQGQRPLVRAAAAGLLVLLVVGAGGPAFAHDPGQGEEVAPAVLTAVRDGDRIDLEVAGRADACAAWRPVQVVARRAGRSVAGPLSAEDGCRFTGTVEVDEAGRWFVYAELDIGGRRTEAWLPVESGRHVKDTVLYVAAGDGPHAIQVMAGVVLYLFVGAILAAVVAAYRRAARSCGDGRGGAVDRAAERVPVGAR